MADINQAMQRFEEAGISRTDRYQTGVQGKGQKWAASKARAKSNYVPAMQEALSKNSYEKGLDKADASDYDQGVQGKGVANWGVGMQAGASKYQQGVQKYANLWDQNLPTERGPRRSAANLKRMTENVQRFVALKS